MERFKNPRTTMTAIAVPAKLAGFIIAPTIFSAQTETHRSRGKLVLAVGGTLPFYDGKRETTFAMPHPIAPHYS